MLEQEVVMDEEDGSAVYQRACVVVLVSSCTSVSRLGLSCAFALFISSCPF